MKTRELRSQETPEPLDTVLIEGTNEILIEPIEWERLTGPIITLEAIAQVAMWQKRFKHLRLLRVLDEKAKIDPVTREVIQAAYDEDLLGKGEWV